ncbi:ATP-binding protein [Thalassotalea sp. G2M2-11]|uniref:GAF domain-containing sensor histidine kinase n=1 Tax=Thalassotalea sp. G2M2-11 TaxID=2787627 RepID=UPI001F49AF9A|nr:ATP-binding protein [Thalassotalea sp. G2M2-11]
MNDLSFQISDILKKLKSTYGSDFFNSLTWQLHQLIGADYTFIARVDLSRRISSTISLVAEHKIAENIEYSLDNTPCANVTDDDVCIYPEDITHLFPNDQMLIDLAIEGYVGTPLHDSSGKVMGLIVALYKNKIEYPNVISDLFELFAGRISAEIERSEKEKQLRELNSTLELKVEERTSELTHALAKLHETQNQIVEQEKLASLGQLVAGVAHEINSPLGIAILGNSTMMNSLEKLNDMLHSNRLSRAKVDKMLNDIFQAQHSLEFNLKRAAELVASFKQMATDYNLDEKTDFELVQWLANVTTSINPLIKTSGVTLSIHTTEKVMNCRSYPAKLTQVLTNIISNAINHAFPEQAAITEPKVTIWLSSDKNNYQLKVADNGIGMDKETVNRILEPFFTTKRGVGGTGLGLSIVNNLIIGPLKGQLDIQSEQGIGTTINLLFPIKN